MNLKLPKKALSYSAINLWYKDKRAYRRKYYEGIYPPETKYTIFGRQAEEEVYAGKLPGVPFFGGKQKKLVTEIAGVPIIAYLDSFDEETKQIIDYKSGILKKDGAPRWTKVDVHNLKQLPFYSLLVERIYGNAHPEALLVWLETELRKPDTLLSQGEKVALTGKFQIFKRRIAKWEREQMVEWTRKAAKEISWDYEKWLAGIEDPPRYGV